MSFWDFSLVVQGGVHMMNYTAMTSYACVLCLVLSDVSFRWPALIHFEVWSREFFDWGKIL